MGSLRKDTCNHFPLKAVQKLVPDGAAMNLIELRGIPAAIIGASASSTGTACAQYHLRQILVTLDMHVVKHPEVMIGNAAQRFDQSGRLTDEPTSKFIQKLLGALVHLASCNNEPVSKSQDS